MQSSEVLLNDKKEDTYQIDKKIKYKYDLKLCISNGYISKHVKQIVTYLSIVYIIAVDVKF